MSRSARAAIRRAGRMRYSRMGGSAILSSQWCGIAAGLRRGCDLQREPQQWQLASVLEFGGPGTDAPAAHLEIEPLGVRIADDDQRGMAEAAGGIDGMPPQG